MENDILIMIIKLVIFLPLTILMLYFILKYTGAKMQDINKNKIVNIIERVGISKTSYLVVIKVIEDYYLMQVDSGKSKLLMKLDNDKVNDLKKNSILQQQNNKVQALKLLDFLRKKEDKYEDK